MVTRRRFTADFKARVALEARVALDIIRTK